MIEIREYLDTAGRSFFGAWFDALNAPAAAKAATAVARIGQGNFSNVKGVGSGVYEYRIDVGPGYRIYFGKDGERVVILLGGGTEEAPAAGHRYRDRVVAGLQTAETLGGDMALTRDFKQTIQARVRRDPAFRKALLREAIENFLSGDMETGKNGLRDFINATVGFGNLGRAMHRSPKSLMRMLGPTGNPHAKNLFEIVAFLQQRERVRFKVQSSSVAA